MKKLIIILLLTAGSLFSQNIIKKNDFAVDLTPVKLTNNLDTIKSYFAYNCEINKYFYRIELKEKIEFTSDVIIVFFKFKDWDGKPFNALADSSSINVIIESIDELKFIREFEYIEFQSINDVFVYKTTEPKNCYFKKLLEIKKECYK